MRHGAFDREVPLVPKIALKPILGVLGDASRAYFVPDLLIPRVPTLQLALIEKDLDVGDRSALANLPRRLRILRGVA